MGVNITYTSDDVKDCTIKCNEGGMVGILQFQRRRQVMVIWTLLRVRFVQRSAH